MEVAKPAGPVGHAEAGERPVVLLAAPASLNNKHGTSGRKDGHSDLERFIEPTCQLSNLKKKKKKIEKRIIW